jgi:hypothetical protein
MAIDNCIRIREPLNKLVNQSIVQVSKPTSSLARRCSLTMGK